MGYSSMVYSGKLLDDLRNNYDKGDREYTICFALGDVCCVVRPASFGDF